ncbi:MAG: phosphoenolpyruvate--protein phosphotransferase [Desulfobacterales bacterium]
MKSNTDEIRLQGIGASPGICIGKAYLVDKEGVDIVRQYFIEQDDLPNETQRFKAAVKQAQNELNDIIANVNHDVAEQTSILETHKILLKDKMLYGKTLEAINNLQVNAEWALKIVVQEVKSIFSNMSDPYLRERVNDITQVSNRIMTNLLGAERVDIGAINKRVILVAHDLSPAETSQIDLERIKGFATDVGGKTSHTGIIARTMAIPAVLGLGNASQKIRNNDLLVVDGSSGMVIMHPSEATLLEYEERQILFEAHQAFLARSSHQAAQTRDGHPLRVFANIELPEEVTSAIDFGGDGIGLYRTEFQYLGRSDFPSELELFDAYRDVVDVMGGKPVTIRTLDINGDKVIISISNPPEPNPALGLRAIRYCLRNPEIFKTQLRAILRVAALGNVRIMFPMISSYEELTAAKQILFETADELEAQGTPHNRDLSVGMMMEVPSAAMIADIMAPEVEFFSIGTNDLIQYSLAIDRVNPQVAHLYSPLHPAILRTLKHVADIARQQGIKLFMCGEMAGEPIFIPILLALGLDEISMNPRSVPLVKNLVRAVALKEAQELLETLLSQKTTQQNLTLLQEKYGALVADTVRYNGNQTPSPNGGPHGPSQA